MNQEWDEAKTDNTFWAEILIVCGVDKAKDICSEYCFHKSLCVTVTPTTYIYTGGREEGVIVRLINYPRFPKMSKEVTDTAIELGFVLAEKSHQGSFSIQDPQEIKWYSRRGDIVETNNEEEDDWRDRDNPRCPECHEEWSGG